MYLKHSFVHPTTISWESTLTRHDASCRGQRLKLEESVSPRRQLTVQPRPQQTAILAHTVYEARETYGALSRRDPETTSWWLIGSKTEKRAMGAGRGEKPCGKGSHLLGLWRTGEGVMRGERRGKKWNQQARVRSGREGVAVDQV